MILQSMFLWAIIKSLVKLSILQNKVSSSSAPVWANFVILICFLLDSMFFSNFFYLLHVFISNCFLLDVRFSNIFKDLINLLRRQPLNILFLDNKIVNSEFILATLFAY
jgi:hypothetical protein